MYCKKCGCKINSGEKKCSECGTEIIGIEYNGGFWGLVGEETKVTKIPPIEESATVTPKKELREEFTKTKQDVEIKKKYRTRSRLFTYLFSVTLIICVIQTILVFILSDKYKTIQREYDIINRDYQNLVLENSNLKEQLNEKEEQTPPSDNTLDSDKDSILSNDNQMETLEHLERRNVINE